MSADPRFPQFSGGIKFIFSMNNCIRVQCKIVALLPIVEARKLCLLSVSGLIHSSHSIKCQHRHRHGRTTTDLLETRKRKQTAVVAEGELLFIMIPNFSSQGCERDRGICNSSFFPLRNEADTMLIIHLTTFTFGSRKPSTHLACSLAWRTCSSGEPDSQDVALFTFLLAFV